MTGDPTSSPTDGATASPTRGAGLPLLDELIPAPWPTRRRAVALATGMLLVAVVLVTIRSGLVGPQLVHDNGWGSSVDSTASGSLVGERILPLRNRGWLPVTVEAVVFPDLADVTWLAVVGLPVTIEPGEVHELAIPFEVAGCHLDAEGFDRFPVRASSGVLPARVVDVAPPFSADPMVETTHLDETGGEIVLPLWPEQGPSWLLGVIDGPCNSAPILDTPPA